MSDHVGLSRLLDLEDDPALLELRCPSTGVLAWPAIRQDVFRLLIGDHFYPNEPLINLAHRPNPRRLVTGAVRASIHNVWHAPKRSDVLIISNGSGLIPRVGRSFNRYTDYFAGSLGDRAWLVESLYADVWPRPPRWNQRLSFVAHQRLALLINGQVFARSIHRQLAEDLVAIVARRGRDLFGWELGAARRAGLVKVATRRLANYPMQARITRSLLRQTRPRLVLEGEGCYGHMAVFNASAREAGVTVAEFQHGLITRGHDAYNVSPRLSLSAAYRQTQPNAFLGYGRWWNEQFNAPVGEKVVIGHPHRAETLRAWRPSSARKTVLIIGDGIQTDTYVALSRELAAIAPSRLHVMFRPHPRERSRMGPDKPALAIDREPDLYDSLAECEAIVAEASTALFEAVGLVPRIFVWDTDRSRHYLGDHPFERFTDASDLADMLATDDRGHLDEGLSSGIWAKDWMRRFLTFVDGFG